MQYLAFFALATSLGVANGSIPGTATIGTVTSPSYLTTLDNKALFQAGSARSELWVSDGTATGTYAVGGTHNAGVTGAYSGGLGPGAVISSSSDIQFAKFGNKALFSGLDSTKFRGLWVTDGTAAGTVEIGGLGNKGIAQQYFSGFSPGGFTALGNNLVFAATDTDDYVGLWISDGTAGGTYPIGGLRNAGIAGVPQAPVSFYPDNFTALGNKVLFRSNYGSLPLWVTDGTVAGTIQLPAFNGTPTIALGSKAYFHGGNNGLWVTDGTVAGTGEITGIQGTYLYGGLHPTNFAVFGNKLLLNGIDSAASNTLWISDGTGAGTTEIGGLKNAGVTGVGLSGLSPSNIVQAGNQAFFSGVDASGQDCLWVTDGTAAGTVEIGGINNAGVVGAPKGGLVPQSMVSIGQRVIFIGYNSSGSLATWVSDGTTAGTYQLASPTVGADLTALTGSPAGVGDFYGNGYSTLLWQNTNGQPALWQVNGNLGLSGALIGGNPGPSWKIVGTGDFTGTGFSDILWQNTNGQPAVWLMNGTEVVSGPLIGGNPGPSWHIVGTGHFAGSGFSDILWQNDNGQAAVWLMNGTQVANSLLIGGNPGPSWKVVGVGDFNGDGFSDILWQNTNGQPAIWLMNGTQVSASELVGGNPGTSWKVAGAGDFNGDGFSDILWQNSNGQAAIWLMNGFQGIGSGLAGPNPGPSWNVIGAGDFNGDGMSDILWQNTNGQAAIWLVNGLQITGGGLVGGNPGASWVAIKE